MKRLKSQRLQSLENDVVSEEVTNYHEIVPQSLARTLLSTKMTLSDILSSCNGDNQITLLTSACHNMFIQWSAPSFAKLFQWSTEEITGYDMQFLYGTDTSQRDVKRMLHDAKNYRHGSARLILCRKDGMMVQVNVCVKPVYDFSENVTLLTNYLFLMTNCVDMLDENYNSIVQQTKLMCRSSSNNNVCGDDIQVLEARPVTPDQIFVDSESVSSVGYIHPHDISPSNSSPTDYFDADESDSYNPDSDDTDSAGTNSEDEAYLSQYTIDRRIVCKSDLSNFVALNESEFHPLMSVCNLSQVLEVMSRAVGTPLILLDCIGRITLANAAYCAMYGYKNTDMQQRFYTNMFFGQFSNFDVTEDMDSFIQLKKNRLYQSFTVVSHHKNNFCLSVNINAAIIRTRKNQKHHIVCMVESANF